jgi:hypothetical protein
MRSCGLDSCGLSYNPEHDREPLAFTKGRELLDQLVDRSYGFSGYIKQPMRGTVRLEVFIVVMKNLEL